VGGTGDLDYVAGEGQVVQVAPEEREDPVEVSGDTVQGEPLDLTDLRGEVVVVNVWWSGCGPCIREMPMLVEAQQELAPDLVEFVGINIRDLSTDDAAAFERQVGVDYPSLHDPGSETLLGFGSYQPHATPSTLLLDRDGRVAALISGEIPSKGTLTELVEEIGAEGAEAGG